MWKISELIECRQVSENIIECVCLRSPVWNIQIKTYSRLCVHYTLCTLAYTKSPREKKIGFTFISLQSKQAKVCHGFAFVFTYEYARAVWTKVRLVIVCCLRIWILITEYKQIYPWKSEWQVIFRNECAYVRSKSVNILSVAIYSEFFCNGIYIYLNLCRAFMRGKDCKANALKLTLTSRHYDWPTNTKCMDRLTT